MPSAFHWNTVPVNYYTVAVQNHARTTFAFPPAYTTSLFVRTVALPGHTRQDFAPKTWPSFFFTTTSHFLLGKTKPMYIPKKTRHVTGKLNVKEQLAWPPKHSWSLKPQGKGYYLIWKNGKNQGMSAHMSRNPINEIRSDFVSGTLGITKSGVRHPASDRLLTDTRTLIR